MKLRCEERKDAGDRLVFSLCEDCEDGECCCGDVDLCVSKNGEPRQLFLSFSVVANKLCITNYEPASLNGLLNVDDDGDLVIER
jgi:hypothetical protein